MHACMWEKASLVRAVDTGEARRRGMVQFMVQSDTGMGVHIESGHPTHTLTIRVPHIRRTRPATATRTYIIVLHWTPNASFVA